MAQAYSPTAKVLNAHGIPHLRFSYTAPILYQVSPDFDLQNTDYLLSLLPLPLVLGGVGIVTTIAFLLAIMLRLCLLSCKALIRSCPCNAAKKCHLFRCCTCCKKGCMHPDSGCNRHCCCCYKQVSRISYDTATASTKARAVSSVSGKIRVHNQMRASLMWAYALTLFFVMAADCLVWYAQVQIASAIVHLSSAIGSLSFVFSSIVAASVAILFTLDHILVAVVTPPCTPFVPQAQREAVEASGESLRVAGKRMEAYALPIVEKMDWLAAYLAHTVEPAVERCIYTFFMVLVAVVLVYALGEHLQYRVIMRAALLLSAVIVLGLTGVCAAVMALVTLLGDFCMDPASNVLSLIGDKESLLYSELKYYITCTGENPFELDLDASFLANANMNSSFATMARQLTGHCIDDLYASSQAVAGNVQAIQELMACPRVYALWRQAVELAFCTEGIGGLYDIWITFFVASTLLFFAMVQAYVFYTWFLEIDVIGTGWFSDEQIRDTKECKRFAKEAEAEAEAEAGGEGGEDEYVIDDGDEGHGGDGGGVDTIVGVQDLCHHHDHHRHHAGHEEDGCIELTFTHDDVEYTVHALTLP